MKADRKATALTRAYEHVLTRAGSAGLDRLVQEAVSAHLMWIVCDIAGHEGEPRPRGRWKDAAWVCPRCKEIRVCRQSFDSDGQVRYQWRSASVEDLLA